jgi:hypothetical protein
VYFLFAAMFGAALAGCAGLDSPGSGPVVDAPVYRVGDRWIYRGEDGFRVRSRWEETHEVTALGPDGITVRVTRKDADIDSVHTERWAAPGLVQVGAVYADETRRFTTPLKRFDFPLAVGKTWNHWVDQFNEATQRQGRINYFVRVARSGRVSTPAGTFDALELHVMMQLDDDEFWRWPTRSNNIMWYAPGVRNMVRETKSSQYIEKGEMNYQFPIRTQFGTLELISFTPGGP